MRQIDKFFDTESTRQKHAFFRYFIIYKTGTIQHMTKMTDSNWPHKILRLCEDMGLDIQRVDREHTDKKGKKTFWREYRCKTSHFKLSKINEAFEKKDIREIGRLCHGKAVYLK